MMRVFSLMNPKHPVGIACDTCGAEIKVPRQRNEAGDQWVTGEDLIKFWMDHQLLECREVTGENSTSG